MDHQNHNTQSRKNKHLNFKERMIIELRLNDGFSAYKIAKGQTIAGVTGTYTSNANVQVLHNYTVAQTNSTTLSTSKDITTVANSVYPSLDKESIRVVSGMPKWIPGKANGKTVRVKYTIPITFRLN